MPEIWTDFYNRLEKFTEGKTSTEHLNYATHISLNHKYIFVETPKVACSTIKISLQRLELGLEKFERAHFEDVHVRDFSPLLHLTQLPNFEEYLVSKDYFRFCFVRNPYNRLLSCYLDKIAGPEKYKERISLLDFMGLDANHQLSFREFVEAIESQSPLEMDYHWRHQSYLTCQTTIQYDFVGKLESFDFDFKKVSEHLSPEMHKYYLSEVRHQTNANQLLLKYYDKDLFDRVYDIYEVDFLNFSYNKYL